jgi:hypothetical protein
MTKDEALKMAIKALEDSLTRQDVAINACKEALEQPTVAELNDEYLRDTYVDGLDEMQGITQQEYYQEPVAWLSTNIKANEVIKTHQWQGLTDDEINKIKNDYELEQRTFYARAIEAKLKEKNT